MPSTLTARTRGAEAADSGNAARMVASIADRPVTLNCSDVQLNSSPRDQLGGRRGHVAAGAAGAQAAVSAGEDLDFGQALGRRSVPAGAVLRRNHLVHGSGPGREVARREGPGRAQVRLRDPATERVRGGGNRVGGGDSGAYRVCSRWAQRAAD